MNETITTRFLTPIARFFSSPRCVFLLGLVIALLATLLEVVRGRASNYYVYSDATRLFWEGVSPYTQEFVDAHRRYFLYLPPFLVALAPVLLLPSWLGPFVWNIGNYLLYTLAIRTLPNPLKPYRHWIFLFTLPVVLQSVFCYQYNLVVCYIFIIAFTLLERGKGFLAVLLIMLSACTKVYGIGQLALLLCYPRMGRNLMYAALTGAALLLLPLFNTGFDNPLDLYSQFAQMTQTHHDEAGFVGILFARGLEPLLLPHYREVQMVVFACLAVAFFMRYKRWGSFIFRVQVMAVITGFFILFSDCPETHTYVIPLPFWVMAFFLQERRTRLDWTLFWLLVINFGILPTDVLCPPRVHRFIHETFWLDVYTFFFCWLRVLWKAVGPTTNAKD